MSSMKSWINDLTKALQPLFSSQAGAYASADDLAYLAYTGKIENHVRDALVVKLKRSGLTIGREVNGRIDLVHIQQTEIDLSLQAKAMYAGDLISMITKPQYEAHPLVDALADDVHRKADPYPCIGLMLVTDIPWQPAFSKDRALKYSKILKIRDAYRPFAPLGVADVHKELAGLLAKQGQNAKLPSHLRNSSDPDERALADSHAPLKLIEDASGYWQGQVNGSRVDVHWFLVEKAEAA